MLLYCATGNMGKLREFILDRGPDMHIHQCPCYATLPECPETGDTFEANARLKAEYYSFHTAGPVFADDSGLEVDALGGAPGVHSARYAGEHATDAANNALLLENLRGIENPSARFVCVIALVQDGKLVKTFRGTVEGYVVDQPR